MAGEQGGDGAAPSSSGGAGGGGGGGGGGDATVAAAGGGGGRDTEGAIADAPQPTPASGGTATPAGEAAAPAAVASNSAGPDKSPASGSKPNESGSKPAAANGGKADNKPKLPRPEGSIPCPRCKSEDTKWCYYNNYNIKQPRYYCRGCQRYWTAGGVLRDVPPGAGRRKSKAAAAAKSGDGSGEPSGEPRVEATSTLALPASLASVLPQLGFSMDPAMAALSVATNLGFPGAAPVLDPAVAAVVNQLGLGNSRESLVRAASALLANSIPASASAFQPILPAAAMPAAAGSNAAAAAAAVAGNAVNGEGDQDARASKRPRADLGDPIASAAGATVTALAAAAGAARGEVLPLQQQHGQQQEQQQQQQLAGTLIAGGSSVPPLGNALLHGLLPPAGSQQPLPGGILAAGAGLGLGAADWPMAVNSQQQGAQLPAVTGLPPNAYAGGWGYSGGAASWGSFPASALQQGQQLHLQQGVSPAGTAGALVAAASTLLAPPPGSAALSSQPQAAQLPVGALASMPQLTGGGGGLAGLSWATAAGLPASVGMPGAAANLAAPWPAISLPLPSTSVAAAGMLPGVVPAGQLPPPVMPSFGSTLRATMVPNIGQAVGSSGGAGAGPPLAGQ